MFVTVTILAFAALPGSASEPSLEQVKQSVTKALPLIRLSVEEYPRHRDCFSCHHQAVPVLAMTVARDHGFTIDPDEIRHPLEHTQADLKGAIDSYRKGGGQGGGVTRAGYALWTLEAGGWAPDETTAAVTEFLLIRDKDRDSWRSSSRRPPSEASEFTSTYLALRQLAAFGLPVQKERIEERVAKARGWLERTKPDDTEDRVFRLWGLKYAKAPAESLKEAVKELLKTQRADGGWGQLAHLDSDAYATGSALVALHQAGMVGIDDPAYRRGLKFLISTQKEDGTWHVESRSRPFQTYFESGFPYGKDQFISMAASSWAVAALALACPEEPPNAQR
jgi:hypothetical protein